jgi:non-specific serine/threonine protein kinase
LASEDESLVLCPSGLLWVDVDAFEEAAATARRARDPAAYGTSIELYAGELLPEDRYEVWAEGRREELRKMYFDLLVEMARLYEGRGECWSAIEALRRAVAKDPILEETHVGLMRLYAFSGRSGQTLVQYERLRETLQRELTEIKRALATARLLTLTGVGGSGKTRLALKVATDLAAAYPDGAWFVELATLSEPDLVPQAVADAVGAREQPGRPITETVTAHSGENRGILILDNCEHLVVAAALLVDFVLSSCPHLRVLATSRESLGVEGEVLFSVPPLPVPAGLPADSGKIGGNDSVRLFVERARLRLPGFLLTQENARPVVAVCRRLDGLPLAIELAAARMGTLATDQMAQSLEHSLGLLSAGPRTAPPRQRTMSAAIGWSYGLLSDGEKELFRLLSVFAGGFTLEAAEAVCPGGKIEDHEVLNLVSGLVNKSMVVAHTTAEGRVRYRMLEPVRQYAREKLEESGEAEPVLDRHAAFFLALAEEAEPELKRQRQEEWLERLEAEHDNFRAALSWSLEQGEAELGLRLSTALVEFWHMHVHHNEARRWLEGALAKEGASPSTRMKALERACFLAWEQGDYERAMAFGEEGLALARRFEDTASAAAILDNTWRGPTGANVPTYISQPVCGRYYVDSDRNLDYGTKTTPPAWMYPLDGNRFVPG